MPAVASKVILDFVRSYQAQRPQKSLAIALSYTARMWAGSGPPPHCVGKWYVLPSAEGCRALALHRNMVA